MTGQQVSRPHDLLVWGLNEDDWCQEKELMLKHGCRDQVTLQTEGDASWCAARFPTRAAADACATMLQGAERFSHLTVYIDTDWEAFGKNKATAKTELIQLAEQLGCRSQPHVLRRHEAASLARGAAEVLAALELAGGVQTFAAEYPMAAACLCRGLMQAVCDARCRWLPYGLRPHVKHALAALAPDQLQAAAAAVRSGKSGAPQHAHHAVQLARAFLRADSESDKECDDSDYESSWETCSQASLTPASEDRMQAIAPECLELLQALTDALADWSAAVSRATRQGRLSEVAQEAGPRTSASELRETGSWLPAAACELLACMREHSLCSAVDQLPLLDTLGQLLQKVVAGMQFDERGAAAGLWPPQSVSVAAAKCVAQLHFHLADMASALGKMAFRHGWSAAGLPALRVSITDAICTATKCFNTTPRHIGMLLHLSFCAKVPLTDDCLKDVPALMAALARVQRLTTSWLTDHLPELEDGVMAEHEPMDYYPVELLPVADQMALLFNTNASQLAKVATCVLKDSSSDAAISSSGICEAVGALAAAIEAAAAFTCKSVRRENDSLMVADTSCCLASGLLFATESLSQATQCVTAAAAAGRPWAADAVAALVRCSLGTLQLAHAEFAAQRALPFEKEPDMIMDPIAPDMARELALDILMDVTKGATQPALRALAKQGLVGPLLQALPWRGFWPQKDWDADEWQDALLGTEVVGDLAAAVLAADVSARRAVRQDGSWNAAVKRVRKLEPPLKLAKDWAEDWAAVVHKVAAVLGGGCKKSLRKRANGGAATESRC